MPEVARGRSSFSFSDIVFDGPTVLRKEALKRKGVHFDKEPILSEMEPLTMSTSTFLHKKGIAWNSLARAFGCEEANDDTVLMDELLHLCNFWGESEPIFKERLGSTDDNEDSDCDDDLEGIRCNRPIFSAFGSELQFPLPCSSSKSGISSLRFNSSLCLSHQSRRASLKSGDVKSSLPSYPCSSTSIEIYRGSQHGEKLLYGTRQLENAFLGVMDDDSDERHEAVSSTKTMLNDFWSQVEF